MDQNAAPFEQAKGVLAGLADARLDAIADDELAAALVGIEEAGRLLDAARVRFAAEAERRSDPALGEESLTRRAGYRKPQQWIEALTGAAPREIDRRLRLGRLVIERPMFDGFLAPAVFPAVAGAMRAGRIGVDAAETITRHLQQAARRHARIEDVEAAERNLVDESAGLPYWEVDLHAKVWRDALDPDGARPREEKLRSARSFTLGRERNGMTPFWGEAPPTEAALLRAAFAEATAPDATPRFVDPDEIVEGADTRTPGQVRFDVLIGFFRAGVRAPMAQRSTATVLATVKLEDLLNGRGVAWLDDVAEPISAFAAQVLACANGFTPIVVGEHGEPLAHGLKQRYATPAQRRALSLRDGGCVLGFCTVPPSWTDAHHVIPYSCDGPTDLDNLVLLCPGHHTDVHKGRFEIRMVNGRPEIRLPYGDGLWKPAGVSRVLMTPELVAV